MLCAHCQQEKKIAGRGYCSACFGRLRRRGTLERKNVQRARECSTEGCHEPVLAKGLCSLHYMRARPPLYQTWKSLRSRYHAEVCEQWQDFERFASDVGERPSPQHQFRRSDVGRPYGPGNFYWLEPVEAAKKDWYSRDERTAYSRRHSLKWKYGLSPDAHQNLLASQNGVCAICRKPEEFINKRSQKVQELSVDHCHETQSVRGLLCVCCNRMLGYAQDSPDTLRAAVAYLEKHKPT